MEEVGRRRGRGRGKRTTNRCSLFWGMIFFSLSHRSISLREEIYVVISVNNVLRKYKRTQTSKQSIVGDWGTGTYN